MDFTKGEKIALVGALISVIGAFLPWASWGVFSVSGIDGDGVFTLLFGIIVGALIVFRSWDNKNKIASLILGLFTLLIGVYYVTDVASIANQPLDMGVDVGMGLYVTILGGLIVLIAGFIGFISDTAPTEEPRDSGEGEGL